MKKVGALEAKNTLGSLLNCVELGEEVLITRHGKPVAQLTRPQVNFDPEASDDAYRRIRQRAEQLRMGNFSWEQYKGWRDEGRY